MVLDMFNPHLTCYKTVFLSICWNQLPEIVATALYRPTFASISSAIFYISRSPLLFASLPT